MAWSIPWNLIGLSVSGDFGDVTIYTDRFGKKVVFPKSPPKKPASPAQVIQRAAFRSAQSNWSSLSPQEKKNLELSTQILSLCMTGQNLWIHVLLKGSITLLSTIERQSGVTLPRP